MIRTLQQGGSSIKGDRHLNISFHKNDHYNNKSSQLNRSQEHLSDNVVKINDHNLTTSSMDHSGSIVIPVHKATRVRMMVNDQVIEDVDKENKPQISIIAPSPTTQRRGSLFPINQRKQEAKKRWSNVATILSPTGSAVMNPALINGASNSRRGSTIPGALLLGARKSRSGSTFESFMSRVDRRRSSGKVSIRRRGSTLSVGSDKTAPVDNTPSVDKEKCKKKFKMWMQIVTALVKIQRKCFEEMWGSTTAYRDQIETVSRFKSKSSEQIVHYSDFNANEYKANKQMRMSSKAKDILQKPPEERTEEEIVYATIALRGISLIAEYPVRMQKKLAQYGRFECYSGKRPIVKQHHPPFAFYFILFGTVIVAVRPDDVQDAKTVVKLRRGESFGELSIMNGTPRQSTVITQGYSEFLSIDVQTYENLFMVGGSKNINDPDHNAFIENLFFLKGWPKELLINNSECVKFLFFNRDAVITKDSNYSDWIIVIKSGSVNILKKLIKTLPTINTRTGVASSCPTDKDLHLAFLTNAQEYQRLLAIKSRNSMTSRSTSRNTRAVSLTPRQGTASSAERNHSPEIDSVHSLNSVQDKIKRVQSAALTRLNGQRNKMYVNTTKKNRQAKSARYIEVHSAAGSERVNVPTVEVKVEPEEEPDVKPPDDLVQQGRRTFLDDLDGGQKGREYKWTEADRNPEFVHVQTLTKGDVFGLNPLVFTDQPSLCLVSNGCECILIKKKFYFDNCPTELRIKLKNQLSPYPDDQELQHDLLTRVNWDAYKKCAMSTVLHRQTMVKTHVSGWE